MALIQAKPVTLTAHRFLGDPQALPVEFAAQLTPEYIGGRAYLPSSVLNGADRFDATEPYARADVVNVGDWIVKGLTGFYKLSPGEFDMLFDITEDDSISNHNARWQVTYVGGGEDDHVRSAHWLGYKFPYQKAIGVSDEVHVLSIMGNPHFKVHDTQPELGSITDDGDSGATGGESAAQGGRGDRGGGIGSGRHGDVHAGATSDAGLAGDEHTDPGSLSSYPAPKHRTSRPGVAATSSGRA